MVVARVWGVGGGCFLSHCLSQLCTAAPRSPCLTPLRPGSVVLTPGPQPLRMATQLQTLRAVTAMCAKSGVGTGREGEGEQPVWNHAGVSGTSRSL